VGVNGTTVTVNQDGGVARVASEDAVNGASSNAWFYDDSAQRLIVKVFPRTAAARKPTPNSSRPPDRGVTAVSGDGSSTSAR
jgi:hypothetical protein